MFPYRHPGFVQEDDTIPYGRVVLAFIASIVIGGLLTLMAWSLTTTRDAQLRPSGAFPEEHLGPRHEVGLIQEGLFDAGRTGQRLFAAQRAELERFGVVDREKGLVRIPIDDAMRLVAEGRR